MSIHIPISTLSRSTLSRINKDLEILQKNGSKEYVFDKIGEYLALPYKYGRKYGFIGPIDTLQEDTTNFRGTLRPFQQSMVKEAIKLLQENGTTMISTYTGSGKTVTSIYIACMLNRKTLIICNRIILLNQWKETIETFTTEKCQVLSVKKKTIDPEAMFYLVTPLIIPKFNLDHIDLVIVDELHQIIIGKSMRSLFNLTPSFLIGLSATPYRPDSYDRCIPMFFGDKYIGKKLNKDHTVYVIKTDYKPPVILTPQGIDWNAVLDGQASNEKRNQLILQIITEVFPERVWLILVKRVHHAEVLYNMLQDLKVPCETLVGDKVEYNKDAKILIGTTSKIGVGFDHAAIDALLIASDVKEYFIQFLGRCMRRPDVSPIVVDIVDKFGPLINHGRERVKVYTDHGGKVKEMVLPL